MNVNPVPSKVKNPGLVWSGLVWSGLVYLIAHSKVRLVFKVAQV